MASNQSIILAEALGIPKSYTQVEDSLTSSVGAVVQYIGDEDSATVEVDASTGDTTFKHGDSGAEVVDTTIDSGGNDPGVIDVSDTNADTMGEFSDLINQSANWRCFLAGSLRDDITANALHTLAATQAKTANGVNLYIDAAVTTWISAAITGYEFKSTTSNPGKFTDGMETEENCVNHVGYCKFGTVGLTGNGVFTVYSADQEDTVATAKTLYSIAVADDGSVTIGTLGNIQGAFKSRIGERLIFRIDAATSVDDINDCNIVGETIDYTGSRVA